MVIMFLYLSLLAGEKNNIDGSLYPYRGSEVSAVSDLDMSLVLNKNIQYQIFLQDMSVSLSHVLNRIVTYCAYKTDNHLDVSEMV